MRVKAMLRYLQELFYDTTTAVISIPKAES